MKMKTLINKLEFPNFLLGSILLTLAIGLGGAAYKLKRPELYVSAAMAAIPGLATKIHTREEYQQQ